MWHYGGWYIDLDVMMHAPLDDQLLETPQRAVFPFERQLDQYCRRQTTPLARESQSTANQSRSLRLGSTHRTGATVLL